MDVTRYNFTEVLVELDKILKKALFVSIDGEFTGLNAGENTNPLDSPAEYYKKIRTGALDFLLVQFGLAVFNYDEETKKYTHKAYNFYIFPKPTVRNAPDTQFLCQASSLDFLAKNSFNFNKVFLEGIPYLNQHNEMKLREKLEEKRKDRKSLNTSPSGENVSIAIPLEHKQAVDNACQKISEYLQSNSKDELVVASCNGFVRKLIYQEAWKKFSRDELILETKQFQIVGRRTGTPEERERLEREQFEKEDTEIDEAVGFTHVIRMLSDADKLIIGHNMLLDLCHIMHRFCLPLPEDYEEFKEMLHCLFPKILDTKYLCSHPDIKEIVPSSVLSHVLSTVAEPPFELITIEPEDKGCGYSLQDDKAHEAGYDAYITGLIFITLAKYLGSQQIPVVDPVLPSSKFLKKFINKLFLMKISDTHINLDGSDPIVVRDYVFHITFPKEWTFQEIYQLFNPYGSVYITWLTDTTAFVSLNMRENTLSVTRNLVHNKKCKLGGVKVITYHSYINSTHESRNDMVVQPPSISMAKKRKRFDSPYTDSPKRKRSLSFDNSKVGSSKCSIESIPEEDENIDSEEDENIDSVQISDSDSLEHTKVEYKNENSNKADRTIRSRASNSNPVKIKSRERFFEENEDWN